MGYLKYCSQWTQLARFRVPEFCSNSLQRHKEALIVYYASLVFIAITIAVFELSQGAIQTPLERIKEKQGLQKLLMSWWVGVFGVSWVAS